MVVNVDKFIRGIIKNNILELISYRPYNSMSNATWTVYDDESTDLFGPQKKLSKKDIYELLVLHF